MFVNSIRIEYLISVLHLRKNNVFEYSTHVQYNYNPFIKLNNVFVGQIPVLQTEFVFQ